MKMILRLEELENPTLREKRILETMDTDQLSLVVVRQKIIENQVLQLKEMERTKAHITEGREGTLFSKTGVLTKQVKALKSELQKATKPPKLSLTEPQKAFKNAVARGSDISIRAASIKSSYGGYSGRDGTTQFTTLLRDYKVEPEMELAVVGKGKLAKVAHFNPREVYEALKEAGLMPLMGEIEYINTLVLVNQTVR